MMSERKAPTSTFWRSALSWVIPVLILTQFVLVSGHETEEAATTTDTSTDTGISTDTDTDTGTTNYRVRSLSHLRSRKTISLDFTFSDEGEPLTVPAFQLNLLPTTNDVDDSSQVAVETSLEEYLQATFDALYPTNYYDEGEDDGEETLPAPAFLTARVQVVATEGFATDQTRQRQRQRRRHTKRVLQSTNPSPSSERYGTAFSVWTTLRFQDGIFPPPGEVDAAMEDALFNNFNVYLQEYLEPYATAQLAGVDSGSYFPGATEPPTSSPTVVTPTTDDDDDDDDQDRKTISEINENPVNAGKDPGRINALYPAIICGIGMFLLTTLWLAHRRKRQAKLDASFEDRIDDDYDSYDIDHISVDYDGRQEAQELALEKEEEEQQQQQQQQQQQESGQHQHQQHTQQHTQQHRHQQRQRQPQAIDASPPRPQRKYHHPTEGSLMSQRMSDGHTTIHIPPIMEARSSSRRYEPSPMVMTSASSYGPTSSGSYFEERDTQSYDEEESEEEEDYSQYTSPTDGYKHALPSMHGGGEFGMGSVINRGLI